MESSTIHEPYFEKKSYPEDEVHQTLENFAIAVSEGDVDQIMSFYSEDIIAYDMMPPLEFVGKDNYQKSWQECFSKRFKFPIEFNYEKQKIYIEGDVCFTHALVHMAGEPETGEEKLVMWMRNTTCLKKIGKKWLIIHEHNSIPIDNELKGLANLHPVNLLH